MQNNHKKRIENVFLAGAFLFFILAFYVIALPSGPTVTYNTTETASAEPALQINTSGGTITTINLYGITQDLRWKAYVGNITGQLSLRDSSNYSIYNWNVTTVSGEIYSSRSNGINWSLIRCANASAVSAEQTALNITASNDDSINKTFITSVHRTFYVGSTIISNSTCPAIRTFVNNQSQAQNENAVFQEVLLYDTTNIVYTGLLENKSTGFNTQRFDFQIIVPDYGIVQAQNVIYYFYLELQ